uniref:Uncharacterized protein n=1 Tax=Coralloluteibacterium stylophorae TaxID=1776034 RepID=A0A8J8AWL9_9GAMM
MKIIVNAVLLTLGRGNVADLVSSISANMKARAARAEDRSCAIADKAIRQLAKADALNADAQRVGRIAFRFEELAQ